MKNNYHFTIEVKTRDVHRENHRFRLCVNFHVAMPVGRHTKRSHGVRHEVDYTTHWCVDTKPHRWTEWIDQYP